MGLIIFMLQGVSRSWELVKLFVVSHLLEEFSPFLFVCGSWFLLMHFLFRTVWQHFAWLGRRCERFIMGIPSVISYLGFILWEWRWGGKRDHPVGSTELWMEPRALPGALLLGLHLTACLPIELPCFLQLLGSWELAADEL